LPKFESPAVNNWLSRLTPGVARNNGYIIRSWFKWMEGNGGKFASMSPDELVEYQQEATGVDRYSILRLIQRYINEIKGTYNSKDTKYSTLRSFFMHNLAELPRDRSYTIRNFEERNRGDLEPAEIRDVILSCNTTYQAIFTCMFQGGMDRESFEYWNVHGWSDLEKALKEKHDIIRIDLPGRKHNRGKEPFYTLIGKDAIEKIKQYLLERPDDDSAIFFDQFNNPINKTAVYYYWLRHVKKLGIVEEEENGDSSTRYGKNPHEIRDVFRTIWEKSPASGSVAEFLMGHIVDDLGYNKAYRDEEWVKEEYSKALPWLNILSDNRAFGLVQESEIKRLEREMNRQAAEQEQRMAQIFKLTTLLNKDVPQVVYEDHPELRPLMKTLQLYQPEWDEWLKKR